MKKRMWSLLLAMGVLFMLAFTGCGEKKVSGVFEVTDIFSITGRGTVVTGKVVSGVIHEGDTAEIVRDDKTIRETKVVAIEQFREMLQEAQEGDYVGLQLEDVEKAEVTIGDQLVAYEN